MQRILAKTKEVMLEQGASDMKVRTICKTANISRATFYRYFGSKEDLLQTLVEYERAQFDRLVESKTSGCKTPRDRIMAYFDSIDAYITGMNARRFLEAEPKFVIEHFRHFFPQSVKRTMEVLAPTFDAWDLQLGASMDRHFISELLVRYMLSYVWVPGDSKPQKFLDSLVSMRARLTK